MTKPFAVSNRCHHLFASLGKGRVTDEGCLQCPWHAALCDVGTWRDCAGSPGRNQAAGGCCEGDDWRSTAEYIPSRGARPARSGWSAEAGGAGYRCGHGRQRQRCPAGVSRGCESSRRTPTSRPWS